MSENVAEAKALLRSTSLSNRSSDLADSTAREFASNLLRLCSDLGAKTVGVYLSFGSEPVTDEFVVLAHAAGIELAAPRIGPESSMEFGLLLGTFQTSALGFLPPIGEIVEPAKLDLILAPALSVDQAGVRLGRGGGFFDRYLENYQGPVAAVVYDQELVGVLPSESHDRPVDFAVTQSGIYKLPMAR